MKFWFIAGFVKIHNYRLIGDRSGTFIFNIDIMMIIFVLKHSMNIKNFRFPRKPTFGPWTRQ